jgi:hypothetical protein
VKVVRIHQIHGQLQHLSRSQTTFTTFWALEKL